MPVKFTVKPGPQSDPNGKLQKIVRDAFELHKDAKVSVGMTDTTIRHDGVVVTLPVGLAYLKNGGSMNAIKQKIAHLGFSTGMVESDKYVSPLEDLNPVNQFEQKQPAVAPYDDMSDEDWVNAVSAQLFPGVIHLHQAEKMHQPVLGTSSGSVYKTCFIGPELKVAARLKGGSVSFRVTTNTNEAPEGPVRDIFERLGVVHHYSDRMTCHTQMSGPYNPETAGEYRALFGAFYAALRPWITSGFPAIGKLTEGVK